MQGLGVYLLLFSQTSCRRYLDDLSSDVLIILSTISGLFYAPMLTFVFIFNSSIIPINLLLSFQCTSDFIQNTYNNTLRGIQWVIGLQGISSHNNIDNTQ